MQGSTGKIIKYASSENYEMKSTIVEWFIRTLKLMISNVLYGICGKDEGRYTNVLQMIIERYNKTPHKGINDYTPYDIYYNKKIIPKSFRYKNFLNFYTKGKILKQGSKVRKVELIGVKIFIKFLKYI